LADSVAKRALKTDVERDSVPAALRWERTMMGRRRQNEGPLFYEFWLDGFPTIIWCRRSEGF
jgi:hypothetical protein